MEELSLVGQCLCFSISFSAVIFPNSRRLAAPPISTTVNWTPILCLNQFLSSILTSESTPTLASGTVKSTSSSVRIMKVNSVVPISCARNIAACSVSRISGVLPHAWRNSLRLPSVEAPKSDWSWNSMLRYTSKRGLFSQPVRFNGDKRGSFERIPMMT